MMILAFIILAAIQTAAIVTMAYHHYKIQMDIELMFTQILEFTTNIKVHDLGSVDDFDFSGNFEGDMQ